MSGILEQFLSYFRSKPDPQFIARQLREPTGEFAEEVGQNMNRVNEALYDLTLETMQLNDYEKVLEIGFGTGKFFDRLFAAAEGLQVSGIDFSDEMVQTAIENNRDAIDSGSLEIKWGRSDDIPFPDETFDNVFCNMVIYFWDKPEKHLKEVYRVLKSGGTFYTGIRTRESMLVFPFVKYGFNLYETTEWKEILEQNGFSFLKMQSRTDPELEFEGNMLSLESRCIAARKKH